MEEYSRLHLECSFAVAIYYYHYGVSIINIMFIDINISS